MSELSEAEVIRNEVARLLTKYTFKCILTAEVRKMTKSVTLKALRPRLPQIMDEIDSKMDRFIITKRGKPVALMMSVDDYESLLETLDVLSDTHLMARIKKAESEVKKGRVRNLDKIEKGLGIV